MATRTLNDLLIAQGNQGAILDQGQNQSADVAQGIGSTAFNTALLALLKGHQQLGTSPYLQQELNARQAQAKRTMNTPADLIGAAPSVQEAARNASASALNPTIQSAQNSQQTFGEQLNSFGQVVDKVRQFSKDYQDKQEALKTDAKNNLLLAVQLGGAAGLEAIKKENPNIFKIAGLDETTLLEAAKAKEKYDKESKKTYSTVDLGDSIGIYDNQGNLVRKDPKGVDPSKGLGVNLSATQKEDISTGNTLISLANDTLALGKKLNWAGVGGLFQGSLSQTLAKNFGKGTLEQQNLRNYIGNIKGTIAKLRGGTSFTPNEEKLLDTYTPGINDSPLVIQSKLESLIKFINQKNQAITGGVGYTPPPSTIGSDTTGTAETKVLNGVTYVKVAGGWQKQ